MTPTLFENAAAAFKTEEARRLQAQKEEAERVQKALNRASVEIPRLIADLERSDPSFAAYLAEATSMNEVSVFGEKKTITLASYSFPSTAYDQFIEREVRCKTTLYIMLVDCNLVGNAPKMELGVYEFIEDQVMGREMKKHDPTEHPEVVDMVLKLSILDTMFLVMFKHRPPK